MKQGFSGIDISAVEKLEALAKRRTVLEDLARRLEERKSGVSEVVYQRVRDDYRARLSHLAQEAQPLMTAARQAHEAFRAYYDEIQKAFEEAKANKEEVELRHEIGEFEDEELAKRLKAGEKVLGNCQIALAEVEELKKRFLAAFGSEGGSGAEPKPLAEPAATRPLPVGATKKEDSGSVAPSVPVADIDQTKLISDEVHDRKPAATPDGLDETKLVEPASLSPPPDQTSSAPQEATLIVPAASLISEPEGQPPVTFTLGPVTNLGRTPDNHIRIASPGASRKHAVIEGCPTGFTLRDLQSQNGTYVNGVRIAKPHELVDGDRIRIGHAEFMFRSS
jgi:hypothetical protein